jgi:hypothetical protein
MHGLDIVSCTTYHPAAWGLSKGLKTSHRRKSACYEMSHRVSKLVDSCEHSNEPSGSIKERGIS